MTSIECVTEIALHLLGGPAVTGSGGVYSSIMAERALYLWCLVFLQAQIVFHHL